MLRHSVCIFKQKTAYEMHISDWSSVVCSSDLTTSRKEHRISEVSCVLRQARSPWSTKPVLLSSTPFLSRQVFTTLCLSIYRLVVRDLSLSQVVRRVH